MTRARESRPVVALLSHPTPAEARVRTAGVVLARRFADWELVTAPLPAPIQDALAVVAGDALGLLAGTDWLYWFFDGWDAQRHA